MTIRTLASTIAKIEGRKSQVKIGDVREVLSIIVALEATALVALETTGSTPVGPVFVLANEAQKKAQKVLDKKKKVKAKAKKRG